MTDAATSPRIKITYATLRNDNEELHRQFEVGLAEARGLVGSHVRQLVGGAERDGQTTGEKRSPIDGSVVCTYAKGSRQDVQDAIAAARAAYPAWSRRPWQERVALLRKVADLISDRLMVISAVVALEVGKNRLEALGDVEETADLIRWSCDMVEQNDGFDHPMGNLGDASVHTRSVLKPYGVWAIISPFNFPFALSGGPAGGALVAGNTVVYKPSSDTPLTASMLTRVMRDAGIPDGVFNMVLGPGETVGDEIQSNPGVDGILFTGSFEVGFRLYKDFPKAYPKPVIVEMGGKNPAIVTASADLDEAAEGVMRAAFGLSGQKCSANSRVYVERSVYQPFLDRLLEKSRAITVGDPLDRSTWMGPVIDERAIARYTDAVADARRDGTVALGGERLTGPGYDQGNFVAPTIVTDLPTDHRLFRDELFLPITAVAPVDSLDEALELSNATVQGLTAGLYSRDPAEQERFLDGIEAGVVYVNRRAGATTGAWPGVQPFGGWKGSTATGKSGGGFYYVQQFLREQSQTVVGG
ncbi:MAG: aldehyde dehydrogenase family protein [Chloroflexi bacterium]|nr:aldehyde dehydrogenase family protein [Chloroflexota bacterium]